jgi:CheY-like chemotaxis protein
MARVLVVDDEDSILVYLTLVLQDHGHEALAARDAEVALEKARDRQPDLITLDIMMPKRSGIALYCDLKREPALAGIPVLFISGFSQLCDVGTEHSFRRLVPDEAIPRPEGCLEKPIDVNEFLKLVDRLTGAGTGDGRSMGVAGD